MNRLGELLQPLIDAEQRSPGPAPQAVTDCWDRIAADVRRGSLPAIDVPPPAPSRSPLLWATVIVLGVALLGAVAYVSRGSNELAPSATISAPAPFDPSRTAPPSSAPAVVDPQPALQALPVAPQPVLQALPEEPFEPADSASSVKRVTRAIRPNRTADATVEEDTFAAELRLLADGQAALNRGDHALALEIADQYQKTYPDGHFREERDALRVIALCAARSPKAAAAARRFLRAAPNSIHATRVRDACAVSTDTP